MSKDGFSFKKCLPVCVIVCVYLCLSLESLFCNFCDFKKCITNNVNWIYQLVVIVCSIAEISIHISCLKEGNIECSFAKSTPTFTLEIDVRVEIMKNFRNQYVIPLTALNFLIP